MNSTFIVTYVKFVFFAEGTPYLESGISLFSSRGPESESPKEPAHVCTTPASTSTLKIFHGQVAESFRSPASGAAGVEIVSKIKPALTSPKQRVDREISMVVSGLTRKEVVSVPLTAA